MVIFGLLIQQIPFAEVLEMVLYVAGSILSAFLVALSIFSYYKSGLKKLIYAARLHFYVRYFLFMKV